MFMQYSSCLRGLLMVAGVLTFATPALAEQGYVQHNLVSDLDGLADRTNSNLANPWGITHSATSPWWVNANGTGVSLVLDGTGAPFPPAATPLIVTVPPPGATGTSAPTGIVFNGTSDFQVGPNSPARFIFATEDGTISGWNPDVNPTQAVLKVDHSSDAVYKGLTMGTLNGQNVLYAANFRGGSVDVFNTNFSAVTLPAGAFVDALVPQGFAPFNVQNIGGAIFVAFAMQDAALHDDVAGPGLGYVDKFAPDGTLLMRLEHGRWMNAPWAVVLAPEEFGELSGQLLVGNFGSGEIAAFDPESGEFEEMLKGRHGQPVAIEGLWGLEFGNGATAGPANTLFFAAGIQDEMHGLFGTLTPTEDNGEGDDPDANSDHGGDQERERDTPSM